MVPLRPGAAGERRLYGPAAAPPFSSLSLGRLLLPLRPLAAPVLGIPPVPLSLSRLRALPCGCLGGAEPGRAEPGAGSEGLPCPAARPTALFLCSRVPCVSAVVLRKLLLRKSDCRVVSVTLVLSVRVKGVLTLCYWRTGSNISTYLLAGIFIIQLISIFPCVFQAILIFCWVYVRKYQSRRESEVISTITAIFALAVALITSALLPVDIFLVSYMKNPNGTFKVWTFRSINCLFKTST